MGSVGGGRAGRRPASFSTDLAQDRVERQVHRRDDRSDDDAEDGDHDRLDELHQAGHRGIDLLLIEVGDLREHLVEGAGLLADVDHLHHHGGEDPGLGQRLADRLALLDALAGGHHGVLDDGVAGRLGGDLQTVEDGHARGGEGAQGAAEAGHRDLAQQHAYHRDLEHQAVEDAPAVRRLVPAVDRDAADDDDDDDEDRVAAHEVAGADHHAGQERHLRADAGEQLGEHRDHLPQDDPDHQGGDDDDRYRVDERRLDLGVQLDRLLDVGREALQDDVEDTARLAGRHHVGEQVVERLGMLFHGVGERGAGLDVAAHLLDDGLEGAVLLLVAEDL